MERLEEEHRDVRPRLAQHVRQHDALGLEARGDARRLPRRRSVVGDDGVRVAHVSISSSALPHRLDRLGVRSGAPGEQRQPLGRAHRRRRDRRAAARAPR